MLKITSLIFLTLLCSNVAFSDGSGEPVKNAKKYGDTYHNWHHADYKKNKKSGVSAWKAYDKLLAGKSPKKKILVAVIDGGIDYMHEDLKHVMWHNPNEIDGNGIDDDNNGYIDDIYGWNFLGNTKGENVNEENLEQTRIFRRLKPKYDGKNISDISEENREEYILYTEVKALVNSEKSSSKQELTNTRQTYENILSIDEAVKQILNKSDFTKEDLQTANTTNFRDSIMVATKLELIGLGLSASDFKSAIDYYEKRLNYYLEIDFNPRADIVGDDVSNIKDTQYGNPDVKGPDPYHGTFVAGLIGAERGNGIGIDGIANNVEIMALRAVPNGDEHDKDIALAIRYAVDNGAQIVNMSFGKQYSPYKHLVDDAIKYAEEKGVLLVNAAGNDNTNVDEDPHYPVDLLSSGEAKNMLTVGASSMDRKKELPGIFSNYGSKAVDVFAPGVDIVSCAPESKYDKGNGTSYSSPITSGVAALIWSYYPEFSALEIKDIIMSSALSKGKKKVYLPEGRGKVEKNVVKFSELSRTGGVVNAYKALKLAEKRSK